MRKFLDDAELISRQRESSSQRTKKENNEDGAECNGEGVECNAENPVENVVDQKVAAIDEMGNENSLCTIDPEVVRAFRVLFNGFEDQWYRARQPESVSSESEDDEIQNNTTAHAAIAQPLRDEGDAESAPEAEPQLYLCDDWILPMKVMRKPQSMTAKEKQRAKVAKNCLIMTMMSLELGYGSIIERYRQARDAVVERYQQSPDNAVYLDSVVLTDEEASVKGSDQLDASSSSTAVAATLPPPTRLANSATRKLLSQVHAVAPRDSSLKLYHVMSVKQTLREDLAECAYQCSCRAADWTRSDLHIVPMQFEPLELHVIDALGQQEVPDYFQQPAKAITEDVSVMRGPHAPRMDCCSP